MKEETYKTGRPSFRQGRGNKWIQRWKRFGRNKMKWLKDLHMSMHRSANLAPRRRYYGIGALRNIIRRKIHPIVFGNGKYLNITDNIFFK